MNRIAYITIAACAVATLSGIVPASAQSTQCVHAMPGHQMTPPSAGKATGMVVGSMPTLPGQDAFGALQEIVRILQADPRTDWSKVNLDALREHLIDMNEVTLHANAAVQPIDGGIKVAVTGSGRTLAAIQRLVRDQGKHLDGTQGWHVTSESLPDGLLLSATSSDPKQAAIIRGLGFAGVLTSGGYHQLHHLAMARGEFAH
jgi:hypothetical protein